MLRLLRSFNTEFDRLDSWRHDIRQSPFHLNLITRFIALAIHKNCEKSYKSKSPQLLFCSSDLDAVIGFESRMVCVRIYDQNTRTSQPP